MLENTAEIIQHPSTNGNPEEAVKLIDQGQILGFLNMLFEDTEGAVHFRSIYEQGSKLARVSVDFSMEDGLEAVASNIAFQAAEAARRKASSFVIINATNGNGAEEDNILDGRVVCCDLDNGDTDEKVEILSSVIGQPTAIILSGGTTESGHPKRHVYWRLTEQTEEVKRLGQLNRLLAHKIGDDDAMQRITQPIRIPGTIHWKTGTPILCRADFVNEKMEYELSDIEERVNDWAGVAIPKPANDDSIFNLDFSRSKIDNPTAAELWDWDGVIEENGRSGIERFAAFGIVAGELANLIYRGRITPEKALEEALYFVRTKFENSSNPWDDSRVERELQNIIKREAKKPENVGANLEKRQQEDQSKREVTAQINEQFKPSFLAMPTGSFADIEEDTLAPELFRHGLLDSGGTLAISAGPKTGKTLFVTGMADAVAVGENYLGVFDPVKPLTSLVIQLELSPRELRKREIKRMASYSQEKREAIAKMSLTTPKNTALKLTNAIALGESVTGMTKAIQGLKDAAAYYGMDKPDLIILDPISYLWDVQNEADSTQITTWLRDCMEFFRASLNPEAGMILVHHTGKGKKPGDDFDPAESPRGGSSFSGYYDTGVVLYRDKGKPQNPIKMFLDMRSDNDLEPSYDLAYDSKNFCLRRADSEPSTGRILDKEEVEEQKRGDAEVKRQSVAIASLRKYCVEKKQPMTLTGLTEMIAMDESQGIGKTTARRGALELIKSNVLKFVSREELVRKRVLKNTEQVKATYFLVFKGMKLENQDGNLVSVQPTHTGSGQKKDSDVTPNLWGVDPSDGVESFFVKKQPETKQKSVITVEENDLETSVVKMAIEAINDRVKIASKDKQLFLFDELAVCVANQLMISPSTVKSALKTASYRKVIGLCEEPYGHATASGKELGYVVPAEGITLSTSDVFDEEHGSYEVEYHRAEATLRFNIANGLLIGWGE